MLLLAMGCGEGTGVSTEALSTECPANFQYYCDLYHPPPLASIACCAPDYFGISYCCPAGTTCCPGPEPTDPHCCDSTRTCRIFRNPPFDARCVPAICGGVAFNGLEQCCGARGAPVAKKPIANLDDCPDRVSTPGYKVVENGCGTTEDRLPDHFGKADFTPACNTHDTCYGTCPKTKQECDDQLLSLLDALCTSRFVRPLEALDRAWCRKETRIGAKAVLSTRKAQAAYERAQKEGCQCCL